MQTSLTIDASPSPTASAATSTLLPSMPLQQAERLLRWLFGAVLLARLLYPFYDSPLSHVWSDPQRHWDNALNLFNPGLMGSSDPIMYQVWLFLLQQIKGNAAAVIPTGTGLLCAAMPYGWYRAFKELMPRDWAYAGATLMGLVPAFIGIYGYFMNETLLLTLTGFAFWGSFRAHRKRSSAAFGLACALWLAAGFTRTTALPMGLLCLLSIWLPQPQKLLRAAIGVVMLVVIAIPAGMHARAKLGYFAPFGNSYLPQIYHDSGNRNIYIDLMSEGHWEFGSPSFYNPTFYPFSNWTTDRTGEIRIRVDLRHGRADWAAEDERAQREHALPLWRGYWENFLYLAFSQSWPDNDLGTVMGWLTVWTRWIWLPLVGVIAVAAARRRYQGREWLLPACALGVFLLMLGQHSGVMEARYRKPVDAVFVAAAVVLAWRRQAQPALRVARRPSITFEPLFESFGAVAGLGQRLMPRPAARHRAAAGAGAARRVPSWMLALISLLSVTVVLSAVLPRMSASGSIPASGFNGPITLPWTFREVGNGNRLDVQLRRNWLTPGRWTVIPDDHLTSLEVNGQNVPLDTVRPGGIYDWERGFDIDLSPWLDDGVNDIVLVDDNGGGDGGIALQPLLGWRWGLIAASFLPWVLLLARWFGLRRAQVLILAAALLPYCAYIAATPWNVRSNDVGGDGGHLAHIAWIVNHLALPPPNAGWTFYHPPLYYLAGAAVYGWAQWLGLSVTQCLQFLALALYLLFLAASAGALRRVLPNAPGKLALATLALALWPEGFMQGLSIGNDTMLYAMAAVATWFMLGWWRSGRRNQLLGMALFIALAFLAKSNAMVLAAAAAVLLGLRLLRHPRSGRLRLDAVLAGLIVAVGVALSLCNQLYYHWRGQLPDWLIGNLQGLDGALRVPATAAAFMPLHLPLFLTTPWLDPYDDASGRGYFWNYLLRSALSGEFRFDSDLQRTISYVWGALLLGLLALLLWPWRSLRWSARQAWRDAPWIALGLLWIASLASLRITAPFACSNNFRYIVPVLVPFILACVRGGIISRGLLLLLVLGSVPFVLAL